jgi:predicted porin
MKKSLLAVAILGATSSFAFAASNVTLYGVIDTGVKVQRIDGAKSGNTVSMTSGFKAGSRWGVKGVEDLGNGNQVGFILEQGFSSNNGAEGTTGSAFNRESKLYVQGGFGQLAFGRLGALASGLQTNSLLTGWALGTSYNGGSWTNLAKGNGRLNNAVAYVSPVFGGFKVSAEYSNGTSADTNKWSYNNHYYGIGAQYALGGFTNSLIFEAVDGKGTSNNNTAYLINLGLGYKVGIFTPQFAYQYNWQDKGNKDNIFGLSTSVAIAGGTAKIGARYLLGKDDGADAGTEDKRRTWTINAAYEYPLSKRTVVYGYAGYADGSKLLDKNHTASLDKGAGVYYNGYQVAVGLQHNF